MLDSRFYEGGSAAFAEGLLAVRPRL